MNTLILEKAPNFRDVGGYQVTGTGLMLKGKIFRSGDFSNLYDSDIARLVEIGIKSIIDLRTPKERKARPDRYPESCSLIQIPIYPIEGDPGRIGLLIKAVRYNRNYFKALTHTIYHRIVFEHRQEIKRVIDVISDESNLPAVIHCTGGKDRTGIISALIQLAVGVSMEDVINDYMLSNERIKSLILEFSGKYNWLKFFNTPFEKMLPVFEARLEYLRKILTDIDNQYGSIEKYLNKGCRIDSSIINKLRKNMRE